MFFTLEQGSDAIRDGTANAPALLVSTRAAVHRTAPEQPQAQRPYLGPPNTASAQLKARKGEKRDFKSQAESCYEDRQNFPTRF